jgi:hypothetical protein
MGTLCTITWDTGQRPGRKKSKREGIHSPPPGYRKPDRSVDIFLVFSTAVKNDTNEYCPQISYHYFIVSGVEVMIGTRDS